MISIDHVSFGYGEAQETLSQVSAAIAPGECVLLCGASGCGKTTVTKLLNGLIPAFTPGCRLEGRVEVDGLDPGTTPMYELARKVGSVFQNPKSQFFNLDTTGEVLFGLESRGASREEMSQALDSAVQICGVGPLLDRNIFAMSGGEKQRVLIARALVQDTPCLILDEPTNHLDIKYQLQLMELVRVLGRTVVAAIHDLNLAALYCQRLYVMKAGRVAASGTPEEVLTPELLREIYEVEAEVARDSRGCLRIFFQPIRNEGEESI